MSLSANQRIEAIARAAKPRPQCRRMILKNGLQPRWYHGALWAQTVTRPAIDLTDGMRKEMSRMIMEGALPFPPADPCRPACTCHGFGISRGQGERK